MVRLPSPLKRGEDAMNHQGWAMLSVFFWVIIIILQVYVSVRDARIKKEEEKAKYG